MSGNARKLSEPSWWVRFFHFHIRLYFLYPNEPKRWQLERAQMITNYFVDPNDADRIHQGLRLARIHFGFLDPDSPYTDEKPMLRQIAAINPQLSPEINDLREKLAFFRPMCKLLRAIVEQSVADDSQRILLVVPSAECRQFAVYFFLPAKKEAMTVPANLFEPLMTELDFALTCNVSQYFSTPRGKALTSIHVVRDENKIEIHLDFRARA